MLALAALLLAAPAAPGPVVSSLRAPGAEDSEFRFEVRGDLKLGYVLTASCVAGCPKPVAYRAEVDIPLGLVVVDEDGLFYGLSGTGCCYRVRVYRASPDGVRLLLETGSRGRPSLLGGDGPVTIVTYMRAEDLGGRGWSLRAVRWTYDGRRFNRAAAPRRRRRR
jgi:hypothetical protein